MGLMGMWWMLTFGLHAQSFRPDFAQCPPDASWPAWQSGGTPALTGSFIPLSEGGLQADFAGGSGNRVAWIASPLPGIAAERQTLQWNAHLSHQFPATQANANNQSRLYLFADREQLGGALNGYFIQLTDRLTFFRQDGTQLVSLWSGPLLPGTEAFISVQRLPNGTWHLSDGAGGQATLTDARHSQAHFSGWQVRFSALTRGRHFRLAGWSVTVSPDSTPPRPEAAEGTAAAQISVRWSEGMGAPPGPASFRLEPGGMTPTTVRPVPCRPNEWSLSFAQPLTDGGAYTLTLPSVPDLAGNPSGPQTLPFTFHLPLFPLQPHVLSGQALTFRFSRPVPASLAGVAAHYQVQPGGESPLSVATDADPALQATLLFSNPFPENQPLRLVLSQLTDQQGRPMRHNELPFMYDTRRPNVPEDGVVVTGSHTVEVWFDEPVDTLTATRSANYLLLSPRQEPTLVQMARPDVVRLSFPQPFLPEQVYQLRISGVTDRQGNVMLTRTRNFLYDQHPPRPLAVFPFNPSELIVAIHEPVAEATPQFFQLPGGPLLQSVTPVGRWSPPSGPLPDGAVAYRLRFSQPLPPRPDWRLQVRDLADRQGNRMTAPTELPFSTQTPALSVAQPLAPDTLRLLFSTPVQPTLSPSALHFSDGLEARSVRWVSPSEAHIALHPVLVPERFVQLRLHGVARPGGIPSDTLRATFQYHTYIRSVTTLSTQLVLVRMALPATPDWLLPERYHLPGLPILSVQPDRDDPQAVKLLLARPLPEGQVLSLRIWRFEDGDTQVPTSIHPLRIDRTPPGIVSAAVLPGPWAELVFDEPLEEAAARSLSHYQLSANIGPLEEVQLSADQRRVRLRFRTPLETGRAYTLSIRNLTDLSGNALSTEVPLRPGQRLLPGQLLINEFMADPDPPVGLPNAEYVELFNPGPAPVNLADVLYEESGGSWLLGHYLLSPGEYILLVPANWASSFTPYGNVLPLHPWPVLSNSGERLRLLSREGELLQSVQYTTSWYRDSQKARGGWSLERIEGAGLCSGPASFAASEDPSGGTPGRANSLRAGEQAAIPPPLLLSLTLLSADTLLLTWSTEVFPAAAAVQVGLARAEGSGSAPELLPVVFEGTRLLVPLRQPLANGIRYQFSLNGVVNCQGQSAEPILRTIGTAPSPAPFELVISEIMADPSPPIGLPETEYLELFNRSNRTISTEGLSLVVGSRRVVLPPTLLRAGEYVVLVPPGASLPTTAQVLPVPGWPPIPNEGGSLALRGPEGQLVHFVHYHRRWYGSSAKSNGGWSLEMLDTANPCVGEGNWSASVHPSGGTPGAINSQRRHSGEQRPPRLLRVEPEDVQTLRLVYDRAIDSLSFARATIFLSPQVGTGPRGWNWQQPGQAVLQLVAPLQHGIRYRLRVGGLQNCQGYGAQNPEEATFTLPSEADTADVVISEILFNPPVGGVDFVELYNRSEKYINLRGWQLANIRQDNIGDRRTISTATRLLAPGEFILLTSDATTLLNQYPSVSPEQIQEMNLPAFNNDQGGAVLFSDRGAIIDQMRYHQNMHFRLLNDVKGVSLERLSYEIGGMERSNWHSAAASAGFATPGRPNSQQLGLPEAADCVEVWPPVFTPNQDGLDDFATLLLRCAVPGTVLNLSVHDATGRLVRHLARNETLGAEALYRWDGTDENGRPVRAGSYLFFGEFFRLDGTLLRFREKVAVGIR